MDELKPCPFCGGEAELTDYEYGDDCATAWGCGCETCFIYFSGKDTAAEAIEAWSTRHERTCHPKDKGEHLSGTDCPAWECSECGELFEAGANFCSNCGARVIS